MTPSVYVEAPATGIAALLGLQGTRGVTTAQDGAGQGGAGGVALLQHERWSEAFLAHTSWGNDGPGSQKEMQSPAQGTALSALPTNEAAIEFETNPHPNRTTQALDTAGDKLTRKNQSPPVTRLKGTAGLGPKQGQPAKAEFVKGQERPVGVLPRKRQDSGIAAVGAAGFTADAAEALVPRAITDFGGQGRGVHLLSAAGESGSTARLWNESVSTSVVDSFEIGTASTSRKGDGLLRPVSISASDLGHATRFDAGSGAEMMTSPSQPFRSIGVSVPVVQVTGAAALRPEAGIGIANAMSARKVSLPITSRVAGAVDLSKEQKPEPAASESGILQMEPRYVARASGAAVRSDAVSSSGVAIVLPQNVEQHVNITSMLLAQETKGKATQVSALNPVDWADATAKMNLELSHQRLIGEEESAEMGQAGGDLSFHQVPSVRPASNGLTVDSFVANGSVIRPDLPVGTFETVALVRGESEFPRSASLAAAASAEGTVVVETRAPMPIHAGDSWHVDAHPFKAGDHSPSVGAELPALSDREAISSPDTRALPGRHERELSAPAGGLSKAVEGVAPAHANAAVSRLDTEVAAHAEELQGRPELNALKPPTLAEFLPVRGSETGMDRSTGLAPGKPRQVASLYPEPDRKIGAIAPSGQSRTGGVFGTESGVAQSLSAPFVPGAPGASVAVLHGPSPSGPEGTRDPFHAIDSVDAASPAATLRNMTPSRNADSVHSLEIGYQDPSLGYVELHAHLSGSGVHASLMAQSSSAEAVLEGHLGSLAGWMQERHTPVESLTVSVLRGDGELRGGVGGHTPANAEGGHDRNGELDQRSSDVLRVAADRGQSEERRIFATSQATDAASVQLALGGGRGVHISLMA